MKNKAPMVRLGDYIEICEERNVDSKKYHFLGVNKNKDFMPTVADTNELDCRKYKIVRNGMFVFSGMQTGRDVCIRLALYRENNPALISPAYTTFIVKKDAQILPQYIFLLFCRFEMDRYGAFVSDGSIRSNLGLDEFCDIKIPLPSLDTQRELVAIYDGLKKIVAENEALIKPLEEACRSFLIDLKQEFSSRPLGKYIEECDRRNSDNLLTLDDVRGISIEKKFIATKANMDGVSLSPYKVVDPGWFCYVTVTSRNGEKISLAHYGEKKPAIVSSSYIVFRSKDEKQLLPEYLYLFLCRPEFDRYARFNSWGSARETFDFSEMCRVEIPVPPIEIQRSIAAVSHCLETAKRIIQETRERMKKLCPALVQKAVHSA